MSDPTFTETDGHLPTVGKGSTSKGNRSRHSSKMDRGSRLRKAGHLNPNWVKGSTARKLKRTAKKKRVMRQISETESEAEVPNDATTDGNQSAASSPDESGGYDPSQEEHGFTEEEEPPQEFSDRAPYVANPGVPPLLPIQPPRARATPKEAPRSRKRLRIEDSSDSEDEGKVGKASGKHRQIRKPRMRIILAADEHKYKLEAQDANHINYYMCVPYSEGSIFNSIMYSKPVPANVNEPPLMDATAQQALRARGKTITLSKDTELRNVQLKISRALGPLSQNPCHIRWSWRKMVS